MPLWHLIFIGITIENGRWMNKSEKSKNFHTWFFPIAFVFVLWVIKLSEVVFHLELFQYGLYPRAIKGISGVFFAPLLHGNFGHLFSNTIPLLVLGAGLFYFYRPVGYKVFFSVYLMTGLWVWLSARPSYHIGASGVVYGLASFLFFSGLLRKNTYLMAFSLFVVFLYGSMIWGILPLQAGISWESHLMGAVAGLLCAYYFRKIGLQKEEIVWEDDNDESDELAEWNSPETELPISQSEPPEITIKYNYKEKEN
jgi:membrane associated rhomboid family serine protease